MKRNNNRFVRRGRTFNRTLVFRPRSPCPLKSKGVKEIDYKDISLLLNYVNDEWKIAPARNNHISAIMQRKIKTAIKRARFLSLLPYTPHHHHSAKGGNSGGRE